MKYIVCGAGTMGQSFCSLLSPSELFGCVDSKKEGCLKTLDDCLPGADCIVDFSSHEGTFALGKYAEKNRLPLVIGTTAHDKEEVDFLRDCSKKIPIFLSYNYSLGVFCVQKFLSQCASFLCFSDITIEETHKKEKKDSPSGTALQWQNELIRAKIPQENIRIVSYREGDTMGIHKITLSSPQEQIVLSHTVLDRVLFAKGALLASRFLVRQKNGLYGMEDLIREPFSSLF